MLTVMASLDTITDHEKENVFWAGCHPRTAVGAFRQAETTGTGPARCAFSVGLELGDRPCAIAPMMPEGEVNAEDGVVQGMGGEAASS